MTSTNSNIAMEEMSDALLRSGYLQEVRLERLLRSRGYFVQANSAIEDPITKKSRELDIYALSATKLSSEFDFLFPVLLVECVNNPQPFAVFPKKIDWEGSFTYDILFSGLPVKFPDNRNRNSWICIADFLKVGKYHHYFKGTITSQFCSFFRKQNQGQWMALHDDTHFESIQKLCLAANHSISEHYRSWHVGKNEPVNIQIYYPVLVLQGKLVEVIESQKGVRIREAKYAHLVRSTIINGEESTFHIDIVVESFFRKYISMVDSEAEKMAYTLRRNNKQVKESINNILKSVGRVRNPEKIRKAMEL
jgi:hypothetical protein